MQMSKNIILKERIKTFSNVRALQHIFPFFSADAICQIQQKFSDNFG